MNHIINSCAQYNDVTYEAQTKADLIDPWHLVVAAISSPAIALQALLDVKSPIKAGISVIGSGRCAVEVQTQNSKIICDLSENGSCKAIEFSNSSTNGTQITNLDGKSNVSVVFAYVAAIGMAMIKDDDVKRNIELVRDQINSVGSLIDAPSAISTLNPSSSLTLGVMLSEISDKIVNMLETGEIKLDVNYGSINMLTPTRLNSSIVGKGSLILGTAPTILPNVTAPTKTATSQTIATARNTYAGYSAGRNWNEEERALIPVRSDDEAVMEEVIMIADAIIATADSKRPCQNFLWRGITGYGKSTGMEQLACILNVPLLKVTCDPDKECSDYLTKIEPVVHGTSRKLPTLDYEEISFDPALAASKLLNCSPDEAEQYDTPQSVLDLYQNLYAGTQQGVEFRETKGEYLRALENGYIVEVQEPSRIKRQGVLVGLNEFDRPGARIPLLNEQWTTRHQKALVVFTDNVGYSTCREMDPSVIRRFSMVIDTGEMSREYVQQRIETTAGCKDEKLFSTMYGVWTFIQDYAVSQGLTGPCSIVELENLFIMLGASGVKTERDLKNRKKRVSELLRYTVINKTTSDIETQVAIAQAVETSLLSKVFS